MSSSIIIFCINLHCTMQSVSLFACFNECVHESQLTNFQNNFNIQFAHIRGKILGGIAAGKMKYFGTGCRRCKYDSRTATRLRTKAPRRISCSFRRRCRLTAHCKSERCATCLSLLIILRIILYLSGVINP